MALKCYTRQKKNGGNYTNCINGKGEQMREKDKKKPVKKKPVKKKQIKRKRLVIVDKPKGHVDITVASGSKGTTTPFKSTKPESIEKEFGLMPQAEMDMQINNALDLVAKARAIRRIGAAKKNISEQKSALSSSAPKSITESFEFNKRNNMSRVERTKDLLKKIKENRLQREKS